MLQEREIAKGGESITRRLYSSELKLVEGDRYRLCLIIEHRTKTL